MTFSEQSPPVTDHIDAQPLRRSQRHRIFAGVAGGIAERFDIDANVVRVIFVVLTGLWGFGAAVYLAMWIVVPINRRDTPDAATTDDVIESPSRWMTFALLLGAVAVAVVLATPWWGGPRWGGAVGLLWVFFLGGLAVVSLGRPARRFSAGRFFAGLFLAGMSVVIVLTGLFFGLVALTGVPLSGGIGDRVYRPDSLAQVQRTYRAAIGSLTVDLSDVPFSGQTVHVTATVAVGLLRIDVPANVDVDVNTHSGIGSVVYEPGWTLTPNSAAVSGARSHATTQLVLVATAGIGQVQLERTPS